MDIVNADLQGHIDGHKYGANMKARELLLETDWMVVRQAETGIPCDEAVVNYRQAVRNYSNTLASQYDACASLEEVFALRETETWPVM